MIGISEIQIVIADTFCGGSMDVAGIVMLACVMMVVFCLFRVNHFGAFACMIPVVLVFTALGVLSVTATVVLIFVAVIGLGVATRNTAVD